MPRYPSLFIDKLAVTLPRTSTQRAALNDAIDDARERWAEFITIARRAHRRYEGHFTFTLPSGKKASLFIAPYVQSDNYFKLEYSPNNFGEEGRMLLGLFLRDILGDTYIEDIKGGRLTRLDVAFDVRRINLGDLLIVDTKWSKSSIIRGEDGEVETYYFPFRSPVPAHQLCVYDKLRETTGTIPDFSGRRRQAHWVRFEYRYRGMKGYTLGSIFGRLENPFNRFVVKQYQPDGEATSIDHLRGFFDGCRLRGLDAMLANATTPEIRDALHSAYQKFPTPYFWLRRTSIWNAGLPAAIENALPQ